MYEKILLKIIDWRNQNVIVNLNFTDDEFYHFTAELFDNTIEYCLSKSFDTIEIQLAAKL